MNAVKALGSWTECINLAVEAYNAGSFGIAAVILEDNGNVVARGRNQLRDNLESCNTIRMTPIAHAEINALNNLPLQRQKDKDLILYTTVEPCPMCIGAIVMSKIRRVMVGSADPHAGSVGLLEKDDYLKQKGVVAVFADGIVEELCFSLHYISIKRDLRPNHPAFARMHKRYPAYAEKLDKLIDSGRLIINKPLETSELVQALE